MVGSILRDKTVNYVLRTENHEDLERTSDDTIRMHYRQPRYHIGSINVRIVSMSVQAIGVTTHTFELLFGKSGKEQLSLLLSRKSDD